MSNLREWLEIASFLVTVVGLPFGIAVFILEQRRERANEEEEVYLELSDDYTHFMELVLQNADLRLRSHQAVTGLSEEQLERRHALYSILVSLFERAYVLVYEDNMNRKQRRMWQSWEDFMREWCRREDFRALLPELLHGEDPDFAKAITQIAAEQAAR
jgi:hypothetical protein